MKDATAEKLDNVDIRGWGPLPQNWRWATLGDTCEFLDSRRVPVNNTERLKRVTGKPQSQLYPYYGANGQVGWIDDYLFDEPLILLAEDGGNFGSSDRPIAYAVSGRYWVNNHAHVLRPRTGVDFDFCLHVLRIRPDVSELVSGSTRAKLNQEIAAKIPIPLPPLAEQKRIAAVLNERMAAVEKARAAVEAQLDAAKALSVAHLRAVFGGPDTEKWEKRRLGDVAVLIQNGIYKTAENYGHGHPFLRMYNIPKVSWNLDLNQLAHVVLDSRELSVFRMEVNDLLVSRVNSFELVGKCAWVDSRAEGYVFENMLIRVRLGKTVDPLFVVQQMNSRVVREQIEKVAKRAIGQASINSEDLRGITMVFPSLAEQKRIAVILEEQVSAAEKAAKMIEAQCEAIDKLPAALLRQAFNGEL